MDTKTKFLLFIVIISMVAAIFLTYKRAFIDKDFEYFDSSSEVDTE